MRRARGIKEEDRERKDREGGRGIETNDVRRRNSQGGRGGERGERSLEVENKEDCTRDMLSECTYKGKIEE